MKTDFKKDEIPYFCWDRALTTEQIRSELRAASGFEWRRLAAWIMREAAFADVWQFLDPQEVFTRLGELEPMLGRKKAFWKYIIGAWHELGRV